MEIFFFGDTDKDGYLLAGGARRRRGVPGRLRGCGSGTATAATRISEFVKVRFVTFDEVDEDDDGQLSVEEVVEAYEVRD